MALGARRQTPHSPVSSLPASGHTDRTERSCCCTTLARRVLSSTRRPPFGSRPVWRKTPDGWNISGAGFTSENLCALTGAPWLQTLASAAPRARPQNAASSAEVSCVRRFVSLYTTKRPCGDRRAAALAPGLRREQVASVEESPGGNGEEAHPEAHLALAGCCHGCCHWVLRGDAKCVSNRGLVGQQWSLASRHNRWRSPMT